MKKILSIIILIFFFSMFLFSEDKADYVPYEASEFPQWALDMRRFEVIFFGTIPFSIFYASIGYSMYTYASHNWAIEYAPALFGNKTPPKLTNDQKLEVLAVSLSISTAAALIDYFLGKLKDD